MKIILETDRLLIREISICDTDDLFEMESDPLVHKYIENKPLKTKEEATGVIEFLNLQYKDNGIARWAVIEKQTGRCIGWSGLKYYRELLNNHINFYDLGYRFKAKHWGKGYATEAAKAIVAYGFNNLNISVIYATSHPENAESIKVLKKLGFTHTETFDGGGPTYWFELKKENFEFL